MSKGWPEREAWFIFIFLDSLFKHQTWCCSHTNPLKHPKAARFINQITCVGCFLLSAGFPCSPWFLLQYPDLDRGWQGHLHKLVAGHWHPLTMANHQLASRRISGPKKIKATFFTEVLLVPMPNRKELSFRWFRISSPTLRTHLQDVFSSRNTFHICKAQSANQRGVWEPRNELSTSRRDMFFLVQDKVAAFCRFFEHAWNSEKHRLDR